MRGKRAGKGGGHDGPYGYKRNPSRERTSRVHRSAGVAIFAERHSLPGMFIVQSTSSFLEMLRQAGISDMSRVIAQFTTNTETHNREDTPFVARDIEIKAKAAALVGPRPLPV